MNTVPYDKKLNTGDLTSLTTSVDTSYSGENDIFKSLGYHELRFCFLVVVYNNHTESD